MEGVNKDNPLILVFYMDRELMKNRDIIIPFTEHVNEMIAIKEANAMAFFAPTDGEERIECINPVQVKPADMDKIMKMINDISENFLDIGQGADDGKDDPDNIIEIPKDGE